LIRRKCFKGSGVGELESFSEAASCLPDFLHCGD
jgi:hypothetical protein